MNPKHKIATTALVLIALATSYWTGYVHGSSSMTWREMLISLALPIIFLWTLAKLTFGLIINRGIPPASGTGSQPPTAPIPKSPRTPPVIQYEHAA